MDDFDIFYKILENILEILKLNDEKKVAELKFELQCCKRNKNLRELNESLKRILEN